MSHQKHTHGQLPPATRWERFKTRVEHEADTRSVRLGVWLLRRSRGRLARLWHRQVLILTTRGRRSGRERVVPLQFFPDGDRMIVVAANSGLPSHPGWYFNLMANSRALVEVAGNIVPVRAQELTPDEAAVFWPRVLRAAPDYARYPRRTSRRLPLVRLIPVPRS
jgi:F420H(2)-dependent quinone reductase